MHTATALAQAGWQVFRPPSYFNEVFLLFFLAGAAAWLVAAVFGFGRARAFGPAARWFALAAACLVAYHLHFLLFAFGIAQGNSDLTFGVGSFLNLFLLLAAVCAIVGFRKLNKRNDE